ncbi:MAG TPA: pyridoxal-phosphate dependent enzyme [Acidobacteriota bacterium]|nr:pyridoxal-phosphate dependent enzyme [Acidobacteriota bacterium]
MIDLTLNREQLERTVRRARERRIIIPTFKQMQNPELVPEPIKDELRGVGLWDVNPLNLFRITWKNEPVPHGGLFRGVNYLELPSELTGVDARIIGLIGKWFPTGAHKVGATFGCLAPRLVTGQFDPTRHKAVWPSTGNFCRGGAYDSALLACESIAILPEEMSRERFEWLAQFAGEVIATPGCESNVKEIFDKCRELCETRDDVKIFNQFEEFGNYLWHHEVTGSAVAELLETALEEDDRFFGLVSSSGSAGTLSGCGDFLKKQFPACKVIVGEALQCPTLLLNGFGGHRIEGIGDKHVPWIHNLRTTDMVVAVDDENCIKLLRLFNEPAGIDFLAKQGVAREAIDSLPLLGISGLGNLVAAIKAAKYYELTNRDVIVTVFTDSMELYGSRIDELRERLGRYVENDAARDYDRFLLGVGIDHVLELSYYDRKRIHNLKYFTWIEQQNRDLAELNAQWHDYPDYWDRIAAFAPEIDVLIDEFNQSTGVLETIGA